MSKKVMRDVPKRKRKESASAQHTLAGRVPSGCPLQGKRKKLVPRMTLSDGSEVQIFAESADSIDSEKPKPQVKYGELVILGYNGSLPQGDRGRKRSKFVLYKKPEPTGVRRSIHYTVNTPQSSQAILDTSQHSISYTLSRNHAVIVEYTSDDQTDMFQVSSCWESR
ncbi:hypothetical protein HUJ05_007181 [Dendroctonus ponderosae]|nr:hypothetical protein HUJ05_007181 [Dendroctonus ponderosae]